MTPVLHYAADELGRELVFLGCEQVGEIVPCSAAARARFQWSLRLPSVRRLTMQPAMTMQEARRALVRELEAWSVRAGFFYPGQAVEIGAAVEHEARRA